MFSVIQRTVDSLHQFHNHTLTSQQLVQIAESLYWSLLEGEHRNSNSASTNQLREILADIVAQWESLLGNQHDMNGSLSSHSPEFPPEWVQQWLAQIQQLEVTSMTESPKNQPTFHIGQVANLNTGDVTIEGDQVGIQHNYAPQQDLSQAAQDIRELLQEIYPDYSTATDADKSAVVAQKVDQQQPEVRARIVGALEKGGKKALEKLVDHPAAAIAIAVYEGWKDAKK